MDPAASPDTTAATRAFRAAGLSLGANAGLVVWKIAAGVAGGSVSVLAEGVQSTADVLASAAILWTVRAAARPPDESHPWGHGKFENVATLGQMVLILLTSAGLLAAAWERWRQPVLPRMDWSLSAMGVSAAVTWLVSRRLDRVAGETGSRALAAEALHLRGDMLTCLGILLGLAVVGLTGEPRLDPVIAAATTAVTVAAAVRMARENLGSLLDESLPPDEEARIRQVLREHPEVRGFHRLRTRRAGADRLVDLHLLLDDDLSLARAHAVGEEVEGRIREVLANANVTVHLEPYEEELRHQREGHGVEITPLP